MTKSTGQRFRGKGNVLRLAQKLHWQDDCLLFVGATDDAGYGRIHDSDRKKVVGAHVMAWELEHGPVPAGAEVCHTCDMPPCCNLVHLYLGDHFTNMADMARRGRMVGQKLTPDDVWAIRARLDRGDSCAAIAPDFGVTAGQIRHIRRGTAWAHLRAAIV